jgi:hypothetical protein
MDIAHVARFFGRVRKILAGTRLRPFRDNSSTSLSTDFVNSFLDAALALVPSHRQNTRLSDKPEE